MTENKKRDFEAFSTVFFGNMGKSDATVHNHSDARSIYSRNLAKLREFTQSKKCKS